MLNRKVEGSFPPSYYEMFDEFQADMHKWSADGRIGMEEFAHMHVEWNPRILHADRDLYKESGASYRARHQNRELT